MSSTQNNSQTTNNYPSTNKAINNLDINTNKNSKINIQDLVLTGMFTAIICVIAQFSIQIQLIPSTLALFAIFLTGALLKPRYALLSVLCYIALGAFGVPVFAGMKSGFHVLFGATGGYLMAYPLMALVISLFYKYIKKYKTFALSLGMLVSLFLCYLLGTLWFTLITEHSFLKALTFCVYPFILFDLVKIGLAISVSTILRKTAFKTL